MATPTQYVHNISELVGKNTRVFFRKLYGDGNIQNDSLACSMIKKLQFVVWAIFKFSCDEILYQACSALPMSNSSRLGTKTSPKMSLLIIVLKLVRLRTIFKFTKLFFCQFFSHKINTKGDHQ